MIEFYPQIKLFHIALALSSGLLFAVRGAALIAGARWPRVAPVRWLSYSIDTALLTAAMMLLTILPGAMFANGWLTVKVVLIVVYIVLGVIALRPATPSARRWAFYLAALAVFGTVYTIARAHQPLGWIATLLG